MSKSTRYTVALTGNPNSGKTTIYNAITGSSQHVGNWPGVTVEKKEGALKGDKSVLVQDLPGIYSLSPYSPEEIIARDYLFDDPPNVIINIVDASNIERNLYLSSQIIETGRDTIVVLNMMDAAAKRHISIDKDLLSRELGCTVIETSALHAGKTRETIDATIAAHLSNMGSGKEAAAKFMSFADDVEKPLAEIAAIISKYVENKERNLRWFTVKAFERDEKAVSPLHISEEDAAEIEAIISACETAEDDDCESIITNERYNAIERIVEKAVVYEAKGALTTSDKIDKIITNRALALPIFGIVMFAVYYISVTTVGAFLTDWTNDVLFGDWVPGIIEKGLNAVGTADWLSGLILDGIVGGVGAVLGFVPQMLVLFLCLAFLEDCGYMARIAFIMDRIFRKFGLSGKSFIPILIGTGCGVPGILASRTIENDKDRRMTVITTTFIPCGAKLPIIALIAGALFRGSSWVAPSTYFIGMAAIIVSGIILKKTKMFAGEATPFVMELPSYHMPAVKGLAVHTWDRALAFIKKAGTIILLACIGVWFLSNFNWHLQMVATENSLLADIGRFIAPAFAPLGWGEWKAAVASFTGLIAKENVVGTFGILYGFGEVAEDGAEYWSQVQLAFTQLAGFSFLVFNLLCSPCFAAIGTIRREMMSAKWFWFAIGYQTIFAYCIALVIYQFGSIFGGESFGIGTAVAILIFAAFLYLLVKKPYKAKDALGVHIEQQITGSEADFGGGAPDAHEKQHTA